MLRASTDAARDEVLDNYVYATTSPIYVTIGGAAPRSPEDAQVFCRVDGPAQRSGTRATRIGTTPAEKRGVLERIAQAKAAVRGDGDMSSLSLGQAPAVAALRRQDSLRFRRVRGDQVHQRRR